MADWSIYGALIVGFLAIAAATAHVFVRGRAAWRSFQRLQRELIVELDRLTELNEKTADHAASAGGNEALEHSLRRLRVSLKRLSLLVEAWGEATGAVRSVAAVLPRK